MVDDMDEATDLSKSEVEKLNEKIIRILKQILKRL